ncbi:MAG: hypothetical protein K2K57_14920 [Oscillospiraceae bacterium]|nr:hypothetical protein [Oscillospiraceae bacterium]
MHLSNQNFTAQITLDDIYNVNSADNVTKYDKILDPMGIKEHYKILRIAITYRGETQLIGLICRFLTYESCAVLRDNDLVILSQNYLLSLDLQKGEIAAVQKLDIFESTFNIYPYKEDFIIYGELDIARVDKNFNMLWNVGGADIFVTRDGTLPFEMNGNGITARDWLGNVYNIGFDGECKLYKSLIEL